MIRRARASREKPSDERLLIEAAKKDPAGFGELYELHFERVYAFVARRVRRREEAEDLTAEVFRKALTGIGSFEWRGVPFAAWLLRIAANAVAGRRPDSGGSAQPASVEPTQEKRLEEDERRARLYRSVGQLPEDQRRVIRMRFAEELPIRQIARALGRSEGAVKQLQWRALKNLKARLENANG
jgi:RNA polymerase sigma-70 factor (ECF subfamily)